MKNLLACAAMLAMISLAWSADGATRPKRKAPVTDVASKTAPTSKTKSAGGTKSTSAAGTTAKRGKKSSAKHPVATWRNRQLSPSTDRYREIQQALANKGYLKAEDATGTWNGASVDALKKFQSEQNLAASGKVNSLSLIALGLGPKREPSAAAVPAKPPQEPEHAVR